MSIQKAYNNWAASYDTIINKTRDLEAIAIKHILKNINSTSVLEIGCGTGKNTAWLATQTPLLIAADFSVEMLAKAKEKINLPHVSFVQMDITKPWHFAQNSFSLVTTSLVLEHIADLTFVFAEAYKVLQPNGFFYIGELHPFKQYRGSKARFETENGTFVLECFTHHISNFFSAAQSMGFSCHQLNEWFDDDDKNNTPRILTMLFKKNEAFV